MEGDRVVYHDFAVFVEIRNGDPLVHVRVSADHPDGFQIIYARATLRPKNWQLLVEAEQGRELGLIIPLQHPVYGEPECKREELEAEASRISRMATYDMKTKKWVFPEEKSQYTTTVSNVDIIIGPVHVGNGDMIRALVQKSYRIENWPLEGEIESWIRPLVPSQFHPELDKLRQKQIDMIKAEDLESDRKERARLAKKFGVPNPDEK